MPEPRATPMTYPTGAMPVGTRLGEFEVRRVLGVGGFGIVYLAFDHLLEREVALKEYMPSALAERKETMHVSLISQDNADTFALGLRSFVNEARLLARFDHPSLVKVHRFWEANGTAYMAMALYKGRTVRDVRLEMRIPPDEAWLRRMLEPLLGAVEKLHSEDIYHRDIAPDNILIEADGRPVLLDFGAARRVISDRSQALTAILKPSYAPIEQYADVGGMKQGAWTDIYALGATMHFLLLGKPPPPAPGRSIQDTMKPLASQSIAGCSREFLELIDWMLTPMPTERPQSVAVIRDVLAGRQQPPRVAAEAAVDADVTLPLGTPAPLVPDSATVVVPRGQTGFANQGDDATVIMPRSGNTGFNAGSRVQPTSLPPAPPRPPIDDEDATVVRPVSTGYHTQRPPAPQTAVPQTKSAPQTIAAPPVEPPRNVAAAAPAPRPGPSATVHSTTIVAQPAAARSGTLVPVVGGVLVAVLLGAGLWWFLTRPVSTGVVPPSAPTAAVEPAAAPPSPAPVPPAAVASPQADPAPPPSAMPAPVAPVGVTPAAPSSPAVVAPAGTPAPYGGTAVPAAPARPVVQPPAAATQRPPATKAPEPPTASQRPADPPPARPPAAAAPAAPVTPGAPAAPAPAPDPAPAEARPSSPSERCAKELPLVRLICIDLACNRSEFSKHPECVKLRSEQASRRNPDGGN